MGQKMQLWTRKIEQRAPAAIEQRADSAPANQLTDPYYLDLFGVSSPTQAGINVDAFSAMSCPTARSCVEAIAETCGQLPLNLYRKDAAGGRELAEDNPIHELLNGASNPWHTAAWLKEQVTRDALLWGDGWAWVSRDFTGTPRELIRLRPGQVTQELDTTTNEVTLRLNGQEIRQEDVIHIQSPSVDGIRGWSPIQLCREAIATNLEIQRHVSRLFGKGARPSGVLRHPSKLGTETAKRVKASWTAAHSGESSGQTAVLEEGMEFQALALSSVDAQTLELWQASTNEICRAFRVPPYLVGELQRATWANSTQMAGDFLKFTMARWFTQWEQEVRLKLLKPAERASLYASFDCDSLLKSDLPARAQAYSTLINARVINPNEARAWEDLPPYPEGNSFINPATTAMSLEADPQDDNQPGDADPADDKQPPNKRSRRSFLLWRLH